MKCENCGKDIRDGIKYCTKCGFKIQIKEESGNLLSDCVRNNVKSLKTRLMIWYNLKNSTQKKEFIFLLIILAFVICGAVYIFYNTYQEGKERDDSLYVENSTDFTNYDEIEEQLKRDTEEDEVEEQSDAYKSEEDLSEETTITENKRELIVSLIDEFCDYCAIKAYTELDNYDTIEIDFSDNATNRGEMLKLAGPYWEDGYTKKDLNEYSIKFFGQKTDFLMSSYKYDWNVIKPEMKIETITEDGEDSYTINCRLITKGIESAIVNCYITESEKSEYGFIMKKIEIKAQKIIDDSSRNTNSVGDRGKVEAIRTDEKIVTQYGQVYLKEKDTESGYERSLYLYNDEEKRLVKDITSIPKINDSRYIFYTKAVENVVEEEEEYSYDANFSDLCCLDLETKEKKEYFRGIDLEILDLYGNYLYIGSEYANTVFVCNYTNNTRRKMDEPVTIFEFVENIVIASGESSDTEPVAIFNCNIDGTNMKKIAEGNAQKVINNKLYYLISKNELTKFQLHECTLDGNGDTAVTDWVDYEDLPDFYKNSFIE